MPPEISVVVPHLNQPGPLGVLLESLFAQSFDMRRAEIIVVDNGSHNLPEAVVARFPDVRLVEMPVPGPGPARNRGVEMAVGPILAFIDADCVADPGWIAAILARFDADPDLAVIGGDVRVLTRAGGDPTASEAYEMIYAFPQKRYIEKMSFSGGGNLAMRREVFAAVGPFAGIEIAEDTEWGQRAAGLGYRTVYVPEMIVHHPARRSMSELYAKWDRNVSHHYAAFARSLGGKLQWGAKTLAMGVSPLGEVPRILRSERVAGARPRWRAFCGLAAIRFYRARKMLAVMVRPETKTASGRWNRQ